ncbi:MAG: hypothetical protein IKV45_01915 [Firmicutes bacterium]|nr:hypothetical protein [Bacillota bacterium]
MKKFAFALLLVVMTFALCACGGGGEGGEAAADTVDFGWFTCVYPEGFGESDEYATSEIEREDADGYTTGKIKFYLYEGDPAAEAAHKAELLKSEVSGTVDYAGITWQVVPYDFNGIPSADLYGDLGDGYYAQISIMMCYEETEIVDTFMNSLVFAGADVLAEYE